MIVLTAAITEAATVRALRLGARGVVLKEAATRYLLDGIRRVVAGRYVLGDGFGALGSWFSPSVLLERRCEVR